MCGRFSLTILESKLLETFSLEGVEGKPYKPRYNIAPSQDVAVVLDSKPKELQYCNWGVNGELVNARAEEIADTAVFRDARRCIVLADGFYEWKVSGKLKVPFRITLPDGEPFGFAGVWNEYSVGGEEIRACSIITVPSNDQLDQLHERMPVILSPTESRKWISRNYSYALLKPFDDELKIYPVSSLVNNANADLPAVTKPIVGLGDF